MQAAGVEIVATPFVPATVAEQEAMAQALLEMEDKIMAMKFLRKLDRKTYGTGLIISRMSLTKGEIFIPKSLKRPISRLTVAVKMARSLPT